MVHSKKLEIIIEKIIYNRNNKINSTGILTQIRNDENLNNEIKSLTIFLDGQEITTGQRLYHIVEKIKHQQICQVCLINTKKFHRLNTGYFPTCGSNQCKKKSKSESFKKTIGEKYGNDYFKEGSEHREKYKKTMIERYGVDHNFKSEEIKNKIKKKMEENYGNSSPLSNKEILEKRNQTCIERYGDLNFIQSEKTKETNLSKYGSENAMKNKKISEKVSVASARTKILNLEERLKKFQVSLISYNNTRSTFLCERCLTKFKNHPVTINAKIRSNIDPCIKCNPPNLSESKAEVEFYDFLKSIFNGNIIRNCRSIFRGNNNFSEVDLYLPDLSIAFEYNGLYWHSEIHKDKFYHKKKTEYLLNKGIKLYHIWEDSWIYNKDIIKSMVSSVIGVNTTRIHGRKCEIGYVDYNTYKNFCEDNHLKGQAPASKIIGLFYKNELVSLMSFSRTRKLIDSKETIYEYELIRSCTKKYNVVIGGASKILSFFFKEMGVTTSLVTYCDVSFSPDPERTVYNKCGMSYIKTTDPGFYWIIDGKRSNRLNWTKEKLIKNGYDPLKKADDIMRDSGSYKLWDCGNHKFYISK